MNKHLIALMLTLTAGLFAPNLYAEDFFIPDKKAENASADHSNWFSFGAQFGLNINARFKHVNNMSSASPGPAAGGGVNRTYDDGSVGVDSSGNQGGQTWNWGYQNASQDDAQRVLRRKWHAKPE